MEVTMHFILLLLICTYSNLNSKPILNIDEHLIDSIVENVRKGSKTPAMAVNIVVDQDIAYQKAFGVNDCISNTPTNNETHFRIGSTSKSFTSTLISKYKQDGLINYNDLVTEHLPCFVLKDTQASGASTIQDLLTHQIGLARHDVMWYNRNFTSSNILEYMRFLNPSCTFREHFLYQNLGYTILGLIIENITGKPFHKALYDEVLEPLNMTNTHVLHSAIKNSENFAKGHRIKNNKTAICTEINADCIAPAGAMISNNTDMAKYLKFLNKKGSHILEPKIFESLITPRVVSNTIPEYLKTQSIKDENGNDIKILDFECYGYGWILINYRGEKLVFHAGHIEGHTAFVGFLPEHNLAISIMSNLNMQVAPYMIAVSIIDELIGNSKVNWMQYYDVLMSDSNDYYKPEENTSDIIEQPSRARKSYCGEYKNGAYGTIEIKLIDKDLVLLLRNSHYKLKPIFPDIFTLNSLENDTISVILNETKCQFCTNINGKITSLKLPLDPLAPPISFKRQPKKVSYLQKFTGKYFYKPYNAYINIIYEDELLHISITGYDFELIREDHNTFKIKGKEGYRVAFERDSAGEICSVSLLQKNSTPMVAQKVE